MPRFTFAAASLLAALALVPIAAAQSYEAKDEEASGICAGAIDLLGRMSQQSSSPERLKSMVQVRDLFANAPPGRDQSKVSAAAQSFVSLMASRFAQAASQEEKVSIVREVVDLSARCVKIAEPLTGINPRAIFNQSAAQAAPVAPLPPIASPAPDPSAPAPASPPVMLDLGPLPPQDGVQIQ